MGILKRVEYHLRKNVVNSIATGAKAAHAMTEGTNDVVQAAATIAGSQAGAFVGGIRMISPVNIIETLVVSEAQMDKTINEEI